LLPPTATTSPLARPISFCQSVFVEAPREHIDACLVQASDENGLPDYYRDCVRPLLRLPETGWPRCCGGSCEPCSEMLKRVAKRTLELVERTPVSSIASSPA
jgi:hypothetical protein